MKDLAPCLKETTWLWEALSPFGPHARLPLNRDPLGRGLVPGGDRAGPGRPSGGVP